jgi:flagellar hook protein FlgE
MALKDILSNGKYADDMVLSLPDGSTVQVGEIRSLPVEERKALTAQIEERQGYLNQAELAFTSKFQEAINAGWMVQDSDGKVHVVPPPQSAQSLPSQPTAAQVRTAAAAEFNLDENDPLLGPVVKLVKSELAQRDQTITDLRAKLDAFPTEINGLKTTMTDALGRVTGVLNTSVGRYLNDQYQEQFADATKSLPKGVTVDYETAYKYASDHQLKDKDGFLQINDAVDRLTWDARKKAERDEWKAQETVKLTKEIEDKSKLASLTPPQSRNPLHTTVAKEGEFNPYTERTDAKGTKVREVKSFEQAMSEAMADEDVLKSAMSSASFGGAVQ